MNPPIKLISLLLTLILFMSCEKKHSGLEKSLKEAGNNGKELKKVLEYYQDDSLKYRAACFLIENMRGKFSIEGQKYKAYRDSILKFHGTPDTLELVLKSMKFKYFKENKTPDISNIRAEYLIENIEQSFKMYYEVGGIKSISFDHFCEYILPYRIGNEPLKNWRNTIIDSSDTSEYKNKELLQSGTELIKKLSKLKKQFVIKWGERNPGVIDLDFSVLDKLSVGSCKELSNYITFALRAHAIPTAIDFTPSYGNFVPGHNWNALIINENKSIPFAFPVFGDTLGTFKANKHKLAKAYRHTFSPNPQSHAIKRGKCSFLPGFFNNSCIKDVTNQYISSYNISIPMKHTPRIRSGFAYISIFNNKSDSWMPIDWGTSDKEKIDFKNVGVSNVYLPIALECVNSFVLNYPFILRKNGFVEFLKPDSNKLITLSLMRKYPLYPNVKKFINRMVGGEFQGANSLDFRDAVVLYKIKESPGEYFNSIDVETDKKFRYIRYKSPENSHGNIAILEFYNYKESKNPILGSVIGTGSSNSVKEKAFDGNPLTFFDTPIADNGWVGLDLGAAQSIQKIRFIARTDYNIIVKGNTYEVFYWDNKWISLGKQKATKKELIYEKVPSGALYFIKNHTTGNEERIFTYEDGRQVWW